MIDYQGLINDAIAVRENAYAPYSGFKVGACLLTKSGKRFLGTNVENASYSLTSCAERNALYSAVSSNEREPVAIAIVGGKDKIDDFTYPCGACRQVLFELGGKELLIVLYNGKEQKILTLGELLPCVFEL